jgi:hypothetical protein
MRGRTVKEHLLVQENQEKAVLWQGNRVQRRLKRQMTTSTIFWDIRPCSPLKVNGRFGGTYRLHLHLLVTCFHAGFLLGLFLHPEDGGDMFLRNFG